VAAVVVLAVAARFWGSGDSCLWFDEIFSAHAAAQPWDAILSFVSKDLIHPPLFYVLLKLWTGAGGDGLQWLRLFPIIFGCLALVPFLMILKELRVEFGQKFIALVIFAVNGSLIKYAQEVRMYSLLLFLSLVSLWLFIRYFQKGKSLPVLIVVNVLMVYTHYFGWFFVGCEVIAVAVFQRIKLRAVFLMALTVAAAFLPWVVSVWQSASAGSLVSENIGWIQRPGPWQVIQLVFALVEPFYFQASSAEPITILKVSGPLLLMIVVAVSAGLAAGRAQEKEKAGSLLLLTLFAFVPLAAAFAISWISPYSIWGNRHLIVVFPVFAILVGLLAGTDGNRAVKTIFTTILLLLAGYAAFLTFRRDVPNHIWCAWEPLAVEAQSKDAETVYVFEDLIAYHFWWAANHDGLGRLSVVKVQNLEGMTEDKAYFLPRGFFDVVSAEPLSMTGNKLWLAYRGAMIDESKPPLNTLISNGYRITDRKVIAASSENAILISLEK